MVLVVQQVCTLGNCYFHFQYKILWIFRRLYEVNNTFGLSFQPQEWCKIGNIHFQIPLLLLVELTKLTNRNTPLYMKLGRVIEVDDAQCQDVL